VSGGPKPRVGISACLLGREVRYDGGHKLDRFLRDALGALVEFVPVCPEVECGLPVPREAMGLEGDPAAPRLVTRETRVDHTARMLRWAGRRVNALARRDLRGFVFKARSPSCGPGHGDARGAGLFARAFMDRFPLLPVEDEERLRDPAVREAFLARLLPDPPATGGRDGSEGPR
jgi:uncharacterized protein YbbK (DUF523 family)